jgi:hypothetical protein
MGINRFVCTLSVSLMSVKPRTTITSNSNFGIWALTDPLGSRLIAPALLGNGKYSGCYEPAADAKVRIAELFPLWSAVASGIPRDTAFALHGPEKAVSR